MSVSPADSSVQHAPPLRTQKIGTPERLGRNAARHLTVAQGHNWTAIPAVAAVPEHVGIGDAIDARGDAMRARIWRHEDNTYDALTRGAYREAMSEIRAARALREQYEELDAFEDEHRAACGSYAAGAIPHLKATAVIHGALLNGGSDAH